VLKHVGVENLKRINKNPLFPRAFVVNDTLIKKALPLQALTGPEGSRRLRLPILR
jgi:hypothetical protein